MSLNYTNEFSVRKLVWLLQASYLQPPCFRSAYLEQYQYQHLRAPAFYVWSLLRISSTDSCTLLLSFALHSRSSSGYGFRRIPVGQSRATLIDKFCHLLCSTRTLIAIQLVWRIVLCKILKCSLCCQRSLVFLIVFGLSA